MYGNGGIGCFLTKAIKSIPKLTTAIEIPANFKSSLPLK